MTWYNGVAAQSPPAETLKARYDALNRQLTGGSLSEIADLDEDEASFALRPPAGYDSKPPLGQQAYRSPHPGDFEIGLASRTERTP